MTGKRKYKSEFNEFQNNNAIVISGFFYNKGLQITIENPYYDSQMTSCNTLCLTLSYICLTLRKKELNNN